MKNRFSLDPKKLIAGKYFGQFQSIFSGLGTDASDIRMYSPGDSAKTINRKASAKQQQLYSNVYHQEKSISIDILRDVNYNRNGKMQSKKNYEYVREMMSDIIFYAKTYGATLDIFYTARTGLLRKTATCKQIQIEKKYDAALTSMRYIEEQTKKSPQRYHSSIAGFLTRMATDKKRRAIVIFSDFLGIDEMQVKQLQQLKKEQVLVLFQLPVNKELGVNYDCAMIENMKATGLEFFKMA